MPRRDRLALGDRAGDGCVGEGSDNAAAKQFFRGNARDRERHDRSRYRPLSRTTWLGYRRLRGRIDRDRQRDRETLVADDALDFALHIGGAFLCEPAVCREAEKNWGRRSSRPLVARAILRVFGTTNKHHAEQHVGFDENRDDPFDGLLAARARK